MKVTRITTPPITTPRITTAAERLADAYELVAKANHYLVGILPHSDIVRDTYDEAEQVLITRENAAFTDSARHKRVCLALDILAYDRKRLGY